MATKVYPSRIQLAVPFFLKDIEHIVEDVELGNACTNCLVRSTGHQTKDDSVATLRACFNVQEVAGIRQCVGHNGDTSMLIRGFLVQGDVQRV